MPFINVNLADVDSFEPLPEGEYDIEVDKVEVRMNKAGDGLYLNWEMVVLDGDYENRRLWMITSLKETALFRLKQAFEDLGLIDDDEEIELEYDDDVEPTSSGGPRLLFPEVEGLEGIARVKNEMYDGRERNRVEQLTSGKKSKKRKRTSATEEKKSRDTKGTSRRNGRQDDDEEDDEEDEDEAPRSQRRPAPATSGSRRGSGRRRMR